MGKPGFSGAGGQLVWYQGKCPVPRGPMARMPLRSLPMVRLVAMVVSNGGMRRSVAASAVTLAVLLSLAAPTLTSAQEAAAEAAATSAVAPADLPPPTREEAEAARVDYLDSDRELKKLVGELSSLQTSYQKKGADRPALQSAFETAKISAQAASQRLEVAAMTIARAGIPKRDEVDDIDIAMPVYQGARKVCAAMVAGAFNADALVILTDQVGLLKQFPDEATLISAIPKAQADRLMEFAEGRMKKKVMGAVEAIAEGVGKVIFADGRVDEPISRALAGAGTHIS